MTVGAGGGSFFLLLFLLIPIVWLFSILIINSKRLIFNLIFTLNLFLYVPSVAIIDSVFNYLNEILFQKELHDFEMANIVFILTGIILSLILIRVVKIIFKNQLQQNHMKYIYIFAFYPTAFFILFRWISLGYLTW
ncbi:hypothetical protein [Acinetobacter sp. Marseille-Q1618]|uniref:hypothetical protein n=1 Tax=Acinetobacter sp. Marseille-Q1618 TaxID=2697502 RepID=UPI00156E2B94|nr:hypothetical protein [Acinetobacter sp. Marseille-Q1618]